VKFGFVAKHRGIWPADWLCGALGVSRGGFYAWLKRPRSRRSRSEEELGAKVRASFLASDRTYGARRVWHDLLAEGVSCGLHRMFAVHPVASAARFDVTGLILLLNGATVLTLTDTTATRRRASGAILTYRHSDQVGAILLSELHP
jgi:transposase InsO family protein